LIDLWVAFRLNREKFAR